MAYKAECNVKECAYEKVDEDFDKLVDALALHYRRIHKMSKVTKWASKWELVSPEPNKNKKAVK